MKVVLGISSLELTAELSASNATELIPKGKIIGVFPVKRQVNPNNGEPWNYKYFTITIVRITVKDGKSIRVVDIELQDVPDQPTWSDGTLAGQQQAVSDINDWLAAGSTPIPPPPYAVFSANGITLLSSISGLNYEEGTGPSSDSISFSLLGDGLLPASDDITLTLDSNFSTNFEFYNPDTSAWEDASTTIAYTGGAITLAGFKVRLKAGLTSASSPYSGTITISAPNTTPFVLTANGTVTASPYTTIMQQYLSRLAIEGGSLTTNEKTWLNTFTQNSDIASGTKFDRLFIHGLSNQIAARISLVNALTADLLTEVNAPTWTAYEGYQGDGSTQYIDLNYNPNTHGVNFTLNDCSFGTYDLNIASIAGYDGCYSGSSEFLTRKGGINNFQLRVNDSTSSISDQITDRGLTSIIRESATTKRSALNGTLSSVVNVNSISIPSYNIFIMARNGLGTPDSFNNIKYALTYAGSSTIDQAQFYTDVQALGTNIGWAV